MKQLLLLRHAKANSAEEAMLDFGRALSPRGERDAVRMGNRLRTGGTRVARIIASPALRARRTAELVAAALGHSNGGVQLEPELYLATPRMLLDVIARQHDDSDSLLIVGHNPGLTELANELLPELQLDDLPTAALLAVRCHTQQWASLALEPRELAFYDFPKNHSEPLTALR